MQGSTVGMLAALTIALLVCRAPHALGSANNRTWVIAVAAQAAGRQPYPRSVQNKAITISIGSGAGRRTFSLTVDTGSSLLEVGCKTPHSMANCPLTGDLTALAGSYVPTQYLGGAQACAATGVPCALPTTKQCFFSQGLTGGQGMNGHKGLFVQDTITLRNTLSNQPLAFNGTFACAVATWHCGEGNRTCDARNQACPVNATLAQGILAGGCIGATQGVEAGWTFSTGGAPSAVAVPEQVFKAGLISQRVMGICWQRPQKDTSCAAALTPNSALFLGSALPRAAGSIASLASAPLFDATFGAGSGAASPQTRTLRTVVKKASVTRPGSAAPWTAPFAGVSVLWDTGAYGQSIVPKNVFAAFQAYFNATSAQVKASSAFQIQPCSAVASPSAFCGANAPNLPHACQYVKLANASAQQLAAAKTALLSMYPPTINITLQGGAVAQLPTAFALNDCTGKASGYNTTAGVAVCSYVQPPPPGSGGAYFWLAGPWFNGRFVQFDLSGPAANFPSSIGTVRFSGPIASCAAAPCVLNNTC